MPWAPEQMQRQVAQLPEQQAGPVPSIVDVLGSAERTANVAGMMYDDAVSPKPQVAPVKGYDPIASVPKGYEGYAERYLDSHSPQETNWITQRIQAEQVDRDIIRRAGGWGTAATLAAGGTDPLTIASMAIPVAGETRLATMARLAIVNAGTTAAQEVAAHELSPTRTSEESLMNVGASAILGGLLGSIAGRVPKREFSALAENLDAHLTPRDINPGAVSTAGAAQVQISDLAGNTIAKGAKTLAEGPIGQVAPGLRLLTSPSNVARDVVQNLAETREILNKNLDLIATPRAIETEITKSEGTWYQAFEAQSNAFKDYRERVRGEGGDPIGRDEFDRQISYATRRGDEHPIPEVAQAAKDTRRIAFDPITKRAQAIGLLPQDLETVGARSYMTRLYDRMKIRADLGGWTDRLTQGFMAKGMEQSEAMAAAHDATRNILGSERGTMDWNVREDAVAGSGRFKQRTLDLPDEVLEPYLDNDIRRLTHSFIRSTVPEVLMTERFGSRDLADQIGKVHDEYAQLMEQAKAQGKPASYLADLEKHQRADVRDIAAIRDRLYGVYGQPKDPAAWYIRAGRLIRMENGARLLGAATLSHIPDLGNVITKYGLYNTFATMAKMGTSLEAIGMARAQARRMGVALDMVSNTSAALMGDYASHSNFLPERIASRAMKGITIATGETPLISMMQSIASTVGGDDVLRTAEKLAQGQSVPKRTLINMAANGLDEAMLKRIAGEAGTHAQEVNGIRFGHSDLWKDQEAASAFESTIVRNAHSMTLRPGVGDTPLAMSTEMGKTLLQFKSFAFAASRHVLLPLAQGVAQGDVRAMTGVMALATAGYLSYATHQLASGMPIETNPKKLAVEIGDKSNLMGWMSALAFPAAWLMGYKDFSRWSDRNAKDAVLGPTGSLLMDTYDRQLPAKFTANEDEGEKGLNRADLHFLRRLVPGQNLWYMRRAINGAEDSMGDLFGLPGTSNKERADLLAANQ